MVNFKALVLITLTTSLLSSGLTLVVFKQISPPVKIVSVDLKALVRDAMSEDFLKNVDEKNIQQKVTSLLQAEKSKVKTALQGKKVMVIAKDAVLHNVPDITEYIRQQQRRKK